MLTYYVNTFRGLRQRGPLQLAISSSSSCVGPRLSAAATADVSKLGCRYASAATKTAAAAAEAELSSSAAATSAVAAAAAAPARHYLPAAATAVLLPPTAQLTLHFSNTVEGKTATQVLVLHAAPAGTSHASLAAPAAAGGAGARAAAVAAAGNRVQPASYNVGGPPATAAAAAATAAGRRTMLPTWLFGFACGSAAATAAAAVGYLDPAAYQQQQQRGLHNDVHGRAAAQQLWQGISSSKDAGTPTNSSSNSGSVDADLHAALAQVLTSMHAHDSSSSSSAKALSAGQNSNTAGSSRSSSSSSGGGTSSTSAARTGVLGSVFGFLSSLLPLGTAQAASPAEQPPGQLPTPWENDSGSSSDEAAVTATTTSSSAVMLRSSISEAAAAAAPAVVHLVATGPSTAAAAAARGETLAGRAWDGSRPEGSGFIYDPEGYILTNAHVVMGGGPTQPAANAAAAAEAAAAGQQSMRSSNSMWAFKQQQVSSSSNSSSSGAVCVHLSDGRVYEGRVVACDTESDLAVVKVEADGPLPVVQLGESNRLRAGEWVVALGSPFLLKQSVTAGIISCVERKGSELGLSSPATDFIQTDAAINAGNSGGPLVDLDGCVVAMTTMKAAPAAGVSFAIPIDTIKALVSELSRHGRIRRPYAGIQMTQVSPARMAQLRTACPDFPTSVSSGIVVTRVTPGSPAAAAGIAADDVIVAIGGSSSSSRGGSGTVAAESQVIQQRQEGLGLSVAELADALKGAIGGSLELLVIRETQQAASSSSSSSSDVSSSRRYQYVSVVLHPVEASR